MDFILAIFGYALLCAMIGLAYTFRETHCVQYLLLPLVYLSRILNLLVPSSVRVLTRRFCTWFLFQNHCIYQVLYAFILLAGHYLLISRVIPILYRYLEGENHLFVTLACLFFNCLTYTMVCLTDPGVITPRNIPLFSKVYSYDNVVYSPMECGSCAHLIPARARHCARCDHCVYRFEHHCVWTNCCISGLNYRYFLFFILSTLAMTMNATWLTFKMLREYVKHEKLWHGHFVDRDGSVKPVNLMVVIQYVFMNLPLIVTMGVVLALVTLFLSVYAMFHCWLVLTNQTGYEYAAANRKSQSSRSSMPLAPSTQHDQLTMSWSTRVLLTRPHRPYDRGMLANISDAFGYRIAASLREFQRRLPPQLEFKTR